MRVAQVIANLRVADVEAGCRRRIAVRSIAAAYEAAIRTLPAQRELFSPRLP